MRSSVAATLAIVLAGGSGLGLGAPSAAAPADDPLGLPPGFVRAERHMVADGLVTERLVSGVTPQVVNVAVVAPDGALAVRAVQAGDAVAGGAERTSAMCARVGCLVGVNGDFAHPDDKRPVGGVAVAGELVRSPNALHQQVSIRDGGEAVTGQFEWSGVVMPTDLDPLHLDGVNVARGPDQIVLYTEHFGRDTATNPHGVEVVVNVPAGTRPLRLGSTTAGTIGEVRDGAGATSLAPGRFVLSGHGRGADALRRLAGRVDEGSAGQTLLLRLEAEDLVQTVGGSHILVRDGARWVSDDGSSFVGGRHPRTAMGWKADGSVVLVTVDGRQSGRAEGMTLLELADLLVGLGATEAINLDGGGSTTFVRGADVVNRPSDRLVGRSGASRVTPVPAAGDAIVGYVERPVVNALMVVPRHAAVVPASPPPAAAALTVPVDSTTPPTSLDPASNPLAAIPALVAEFVPADPVVQPRFLLALVVAVLLIGVSSGALVHHRLVVGDGGLPALARPRWLRSPPS